MFIEIKAEYQKGFALYKLTDTAGALLHIGVTSFGKVMGIPDAPAGLLPVGGVAYLTVLQVSPDYLKLLQIGFNKANDAQRPDLAARLRAMFQASSKTIIANRVRCLDTGEEFDSVSAAAKAHELSYSALTSHLKEMKGYKSVKGRRYEYAD